MTIGEFLVFINFIALLLTVIIPLFYHYYKKKGINEDFPKLILDFTLFCNIISFPGIYLYLNKECYSKYLTLIIFFVTVLYSKIIINLQLCICIGYKNKIFIDVIISNILIILNYFILNEKLLFFTCVSTIIIVGSSVGEK